MSDNKETAIVHVPAPEQNIVVLARNAQEMAKAQGNLLEWAERKVEVEKAELQMVEENLAHAKRMKLKISGWEGQVRKAKKRVVYYEKIKSAVAAGYCIVPNMEVDLIAVRTDRRGPPTKAHRGGSHNVPDVNHAQLPEGEGRYVSPQPYTDTLDKPHSNGDGSHKDITWSSATDFDDEIDFPVKLVRPQVLADLSEAMQSKIFDEIGFIPQSQTGDPMVVGRISMRTGGWRNERTVSFLITWWIDTRDL